MMIVFMQKKFRFRQPWVATSSGKARLTCEQAQAKAIPMPLAFKLTSASATCIHLSRLGMDLWASLILHFLSASNCSAVMPCCALGGFQNRLPHLRWLRRREANLIIAALLQQGYYSFGSDTLWTWHQKTYKSSPLEIWDVIRKLDKVHVSPCCGRSSTPFNKPMHDNTRHCEWGIHTKPNTRLLQSPWAWLAHQSPRSEWRAPLSIGFQCLRFPRVRESVVFQICSCFQYYNIISHRPSRKVTPLIQKNLEEKTSQDGKWQWSDMKTLPGRTLQNYKGNNVGSWLV